MKELNKELDVYKKNNIQNQLIKNFHDALEDENFSLLINKLKMKEQDLFKYTSQLEESALEYGNCLNCKNIMECKNKVVGYAYLPHKLDNSLLFEYKMCRHNKKILKNNSHHKNMYLFDIPKEIAEADWNKIKTNDSKRYEVIEWLNDFLVNYLKDKNQKGLYLHGSFGCGKTYLISAMFNELAKQDIRSAIIFWPEFLRDLKGSFQTDFNEKYEYIKKVPLLLIDDIGAENSTPWGRDEIFCPLVQYRMQENLPTFFTSNLDLDCLSEHFSITKGSYDEIKAVRIIERIKQLTDIIEIQSKNLRN